MFFNDNCITFNGEIYNYIEIRQELKANGYHFSSNTDTEVILKVYDFWGDKCLEKLMECGHLLFGIMRINLL